MTAHNDSYYRSSDLTSLKGMGSKYAASFYGHGLHSLEDLLFFLPFKYLDKTKITPISQLIADGQSATIVATVCGSSFFSGSRSTVFKVTLKDDSGIIEAVFFNIYPNFSKNFVNGRRLVAFGPVRWDGRARPCMQHPSVDFLKEFEIPNLSKTLTPVYHAVGKIPQNKIRLFIRSVLDSLKSIPLRELLPSNFSYFQGMSINQALEDIHAPKPNPKTRICPSPFNLKSCKRLSFEELTAYHLTLLSLKKMNETKTSPMLVYDADIYERFIKSLPFVPTKAQSRSFFEIMDNLTCKTPMLRLLHGDVGSGKTLVAIMACLETAANHFQSVLLAPTELLAKQHYKKFKAALDPMKIKTVLLTSSLKASERKEALAAIASGDALVVIGTHSVFQEEVCYQKLALAIIDEQHRFGTAQRIALLKKALPGLTLHQLVMTATPIPRTLQLALFSDLDVSTLDELPAGRAPIITAIMPASRKQEVLLHLKRACSTGRQAYWVCPYIEPADDGCAAVTVSFADIKKSLPEFRTGILHGQMPPNEREKIMQEFLDGQIRVLVATTIIEVGVDVPNASIMVIEDADRLGLAQLHQLRGRVGRGKIASSCLLLYSDKTACETDSIAKKRLQIMRSTTDGFKIAEEDLKLRGPGEVLGREQTGFNAFKIADVCRDRELLAPAREMALNLIDNFPKQADELKKRWFPNF